MSDNYFDRLISYLNSQKSSYEYRVNKAIRDDLYNAYTKITTNILAPAPIRKAALKQRSGILISGDNIHYKYGISRWSTNEYGIPLSRKNSRDNTRYDHGNKHVEHYTKGIQITGSNRLDLAWRQGITGPRRLNNFPAFSVNAPGGWTNPDFRQVTPSVRLGTMGYSGDTPRDTILKYMKDISKGNNNGEEIARATNEILKEIANFR